MATTPIQAWPIPGGAEAPATPAAFAALAGAAEKQANMTFASAAARSVAIPAPVEGMETWIAGVKEVYTSGVWRRADNPAMLAVHDALFGAAPALPAGRFLIIAGTKAANCDANGVLRIDFPTPFPTGLLTVVAWNGDGGAGGFITQAPNSTWGGGDNTQFRVVSYSPTGVLRGNQSVRVNYIAIGW